MVMLLREVVAAAAAAMSIVGTQPGQFRTAVVVTAEEAAAIFAAIAQCMGHSRWA